MTELQLRLWCLWMCEEFAEFDHWTECGFVASEGADPTMGVMLTAIQMEVEPLIAWKISERMP